MRRLLALAAILLLLTEGDASLAGPFPESSRIEIAGCETWIVGPVCSTSTGPRAALRIWLEGVDSAVFRFDGKAVQPKKIGAVSGVELQIPAGARRLEVLAGGRLFELPLLPSQRPDWYEQTKMLMAGDLKEAKQSLELRLGLTFPANAYKLYFLSRIADRNNQRAEAATLATMAAKLWEQGGFLGYAVRDLAFAARQYHELGDTVARDQSFERARQSLNQLKTATFFPVAPAFHLHSLDAILSNESGELRRGLDLSDFFETLENHGLLEANETSTKDEQKALVWIELGRFEEAAGVLDLLLAATPDLTEARARLLVNRGWIAYLTRETGRLGADPLPYWEEVWRLRRDSPNNENRYNAKLNLAAAELQAGRGDKAIKHLEEAKAFQASATASQKFMSRDVEARLLLLQGKPDEALTAFRRLDTEANLLRASGASRWQALVGQAQALKALHRENDALAALEKAFELADRELLLIPAKQGRETFLARRDQAIGLQLEILLERQDEDAAGRLLIRRMTQAQRLLQSDERLGALDPAKRAQRELTIAQLKEIQAAIEKGSEGSWEVPQRELAQHQQRLAQQRADLDHLRDVIVDLIDPLPPAAAIEIKPQPGELVLAFFPLRGSWAAFAFAENRPTQVRKLPARPANENMAALAGELLVLFRSEIDASQRLKVLPWGGLAGVEFHQLETGRPVVYGVATGRQIRRGESPQKALLVEDPSDDSSLASARGEIDNANKVLRQRLPRLEITRLGKNTSENLRVTGTPLAVWKKIEEVDYLHFAGHGIAKGFGAFDSSLQLWRGFLRLGDLFALKRVPRQILLSSCEVGSDRDPRLTSEAKGLGLAQAFVLVGADQVLAATRAIDDAKAARLVGEIYERWPADGKEIDLARLLYEAQVELRRNEPDAAWEAFRVFEP